MLRPDLLAGRVALITGGGTGLGRAMAEHFVQHGARVAIAGRREEALAEVAAALGPESVLPVACDVRDLFAVEECVARVEARFGAVDILVNNAAANFLSPTEDLTPNAFRLISDVVLMGTVHFTLTLGKRWIAARQPGTVLNVVTSYASTGSGFVCPSACAKAGVEALTRSLAAEWGKYRIRVLGIAPGPFGTEGATSRLFFDQSWEERAVQRIPLGRMGRLDELGELATFLVSDASAYVTGEIIRIDGGEGVFLAGEFNFLHEASPDDWRAYRRRVRNGASRPDPLPPSPDSSGAERRDGPVQKQAPRES